MMWLFSDKAYKDNINKHENNNSQQIEQSSPEIW